MNIALTTIPLADVGGMHDGGIGAGWWIVMAAVMVLFMGGMMWMMMRGMGGASSPDSPAARDTRGTTQGPLEILERRFAEGLISVEDYRARREVLVNEAAERNGVEQIAAQHADPGEPVATA